jgi:hypothetical protein
MRAGARFIAQRTKDATPVGPTGNLRRGGGFVRQSRDPGPYGVAFRIGYRARIAAHALIVDRGTAQRFNKRGQNRGRGPAARFFDRAVENAAKGAMTMMRANIAARLSVEARRYSSGQLTARGTIKPQFR